MQTESRLKLRMLLLAMTFFSFICTAQSHPLDLGLLNVTDEGSDLKFSLEFATEAAEQVSGLSAQDLEASKIQAERDLLFAATLGGSTVELSDGKSCVWEQEAEVQTSQSKVIIVNRAKCDLLPQAWKLELPFIARAPVNFELVVKLYIHGESSELVARAASPRISVAPESKSTWSQFIEMGIKHIGAVPSEWINSEGLHWPEGIDHILFVIALVLGGGGVVDLLKTVTGFTIGHSATLALATLGWIYVPSRLVESGIALSIAIVAGESLFFAKTRSRWKIALAFGLLHGLGFASALSDLYLNGWSFIRALIGFNVGVESGQAVIVILSFPAIYFLSRSQFGKKRVIPGLLTVVLCIGLYWFTRRAFAI